VRAGVQSFSEVRAKVDSAGNKPPYWQELPAIYLKEK